MASSQLSTCVAGSADVEAADDDESARRHAEASGAPRGPAWRRATARRAHSIDAGALRGGHRDGTRARARARARESRRDKRGAFMARPKAHISNATGGLLVLEVHTTLCETSTCDGCKSGGQQVRVRLRSACKLRATLPRVLTCDNSCAASSRSGAFLRLFSLAVRVMPAAMRFCDAFLFRKGLGLRYQGSLRGGGPQNFVASSVFVYLKGDSGFRLVKRF